MSPKNPRPKVLPGGTWEVKSPCGEIYVTANFKDDRLEEVFFRYKKKSQGSCQSTIGNGLAMITSYALRSGAEASDIIRGMKGHCCGRNWAFMDNQPVTSCLDAIGKGIEMACVNRWGDDFAKQCVVDLSAHDPEGADQVQEQHDIASPSEPGRAANG